MRPAKRPPAESRVSIDELDPEALRVDSDLVAADAALNELCAVDARQAQIVELRCFVGLDPARRTSARVSIEA